jgi:hypothetical protein
MVFMEVINGDEQEPSWVRHLRTLVKEAVPRLDDGFAPPDEHEGRKQYNVYVYDGEGRFTKGEAALIIEALPGGSLDMFDGEAKGDSDGVIAIIDLNHPESGKDVARVWVMNGREDGVSNSTIATTLKRLTVVPLN